MRKTEGKGEGEKRERKKDPPPSFPGADLSVGFATNDSGITHSR